MFSNPLFQFGQILEDPSNTFSIKELFDDAVGDGICEDSDWFPIANEDFYLMLKHLPFLAYKYKTSIICYGMPCNKNEQRAVCTTTSKYLSH